MRYNIAGERQEEFTMNRGHLNVGSFAICIVAFMAVQLLADSSSEEDQLKAFQSWAVEYAIGQQKASKFQLTPYEEMKYPDLVKLLRSPWEEKHTALSNQIDIGSDSGEEIWNQTMTEDDQSLMQLFRENLYSGHHCEAFIYHHLLYFEANQMTAAREAYQVYIKGYENLKSQMEEFVAAEAVKTYDCLPYNGSLTPSRLHLTTEGVEEQDPDDVAPLYAGPEVPFDWPYFPVLQVTFELSDGSELPWENFVQADVRYWDRTVGDAMRNRLEWMVGRWGVYENILEKDGLEAAKVAFRDNLSIESDTYFIEFRDSGTQNGVAIYRTEYGAMQMIKRRNFISRCTPVVEETASE
jgi:hypothetical protein